jgi:hypothetical protein
MSVVSIGLDLAKSVFQVHGVDASGRAVLRRNWLAANCWPSSPNSRTAWWAWRHVRALTIGRGNLSGSVTKCA